MTLRASRPNAATASLALLLASDPAATALLMASYAKTPNPIGATSTTVTANVQGSTLITPAERKGRKGRKAKSADKAEKAAPRAVNVNIPCTGGLDAAGILTALRVAGKRPARYEIDTTDPITGEVHAAGSLRLNQKGEPIMVWDSSEQKKDERASLIAFCGYASGEPHGAQLDAARRDAHAKLNIEARRDEGFPAPIRAHRSADAYAARQEGTTGFVKGMPNPIRALGLDLCQREVIAAEELDLFADLRAHVLAGEHVEFSAKLLGNFPYTRGIEQHTKVVARPITDESGAKVKVNRRLVREAVLENAGYRVIEVPSPVVAPLLPYLHPITDVQDKVDGFKFRAGCAEDLDAALARLEALAYERLDQIGADLDSLESSGPSDPDTVERVSAALHSRGATACFEEALRIYDTASRSHAYLPVGTIVSAAAIERDTASDSHGILNTAPRA
jgi:hypothetical protein